MFARSAAPDTLQGRAICHVNQQWGEDTLRRIGRESLAVPVCKKKYTPFVFPIVRRSAAWAGAGDPSASTASSSSSSSSEASTSSSERGAFTYEVQVQRMYGCKCHHEQRQRMIERYGERSGWWPFGQWSRKKALELARQETRRLNGGAPSAPRGGPTPPSSSLASSSLLRPSSPPSVLTPATSSDSSSSSSDDDEDENDDQTSVEGAGVARNMCLSGKCLWKVKSAYDNVFKELTGMTESEAEDNDA
jgi:hypothetical protein